MNSSSLPLRIITVGHVDHGKSTLLGRLLYDTDSLSDEQKKMLELAALDGKGMELAFLLDAFLEEQTQNITIDTTQLVFRTRQRSYVMIDAPGHEEFLKNMISGATRADAAILLIDIAHGIQSQTQKHLQLLSLMGIKQVIVILNKMDLVEREESVFQIRREEVQKLFHSYGLSAQQIIPAVACTGENIVTHSSKMNWYQGPTLLDTLEKMKPTSVLEKKALRLVVQDVYRFDEKRLIVGRVESGTLNVGEEIIFWPGRKKSRVRSIEEWGVEKQPQSASAGKSVAITLEEPLFVERGHIGSAIAEPPMEGREINARIFWLNTEPLSLNQTITIHLGTQSVTGRIAAITNAKTTFIGVLGESAVGDAEQGVDGPQQRSVYENSRAASTGAAKLCKSAVGLYNNSIKQHDIVDVIIHLTRPLIYDCYEKIPTMGRFAIIMHEHLKGGGVILTSKKNIAAEQSIKSDHLTWSVSTVNREMRQKQFGHVGMVLWLTGLSGSGKSTIARGLESLLHQHSIATTILDGDNLRHGLCSDLGFSLADRSENIRRTGEAAKLFAEAGVIAICALISPLAADRERVLASCVRDGIIFKEIFIDAPLNVCEARDPRGLYQKARRGEIENFTGITSPYQIPLTPDLRLLTATASCQETIEQLYEFVLEWIGEGASFQT